jgi:hypothetical protein
LPKTKPLTGGKENAEVLAVTAKKLLEAEHKNTLNATCPTIYPLMLMSTAVPS